MSKLKRRKVLKAVAFAPAAWTPPVVQSVVLPAHAATSSVCTEFFLIGDVVADCTTPVLYTLWTFTFNEGCLAATATTITSLVDIRSDQLITIEGSLPEPESTVVAGISTADERFLVPSDCDSPAPFGPVTTFRELVISDVSFIVSWMYGSTAEPTTSYIIDITVSPA